MEATPAKRSRRGRRGRGGRRKPEAPAPVPAEITPPSVRVVTTTELPKRRDRRRRAAQAKAQRKIEAQKDEDVLQLVFDKLDQFDDWNDSLI